MKLLWILIVPAVTVSGQDEDRRQLAQKMMEASFHLNGIFDQDMTAKVPVSELGLPPQAASRFDLNGDGVVDFAEYERRATDNAAGPVEPADRSDFTHLRDGGFPLNVDPEIVSAEEVDFDDGDLVMGVVIAGEPRAYPVNYMNGPYNEVVNDELGGQAIAPSW